MKVENGARTSRMAAVLVVAGLLIGIAAGVVYASRVGPSSSAQVRMLFSVVGGNSATDLNQASTYLERQMTSFVQIATSDRVLAPAARRLGDGTTAQSLGSAVTVTNPTNTVLLDIDVSNPDSARAVAQADAVAAELTKTVAELSPSTEKGVKTLQTGIIQPARVMSSSAGLSAWRGALVGGTLGLVLGGGASWLLARRSSRERIDASGQ